VNEVVHAGIWRLGDEPGHRRFASLSGDDGKSFTLEGGGCLEAVTVAYETWGELNDAGSNGVLVLHALSGDSHASGPAGPGHKVIGWWDGLIGPGKAIDTNRYFVVCPNVLGGCQGSTGPGSQSTDGNPYGSRFPVITIRDQVLIECALTDYLGIETWEAVIGGSMGGMRVLEWAVGQPGRLRRALAIAVGAAATADQIALCSLQIRAIRSDPAYLGGDYYQGDVGPVEGLSIARGIGQFGYRTQHEFQDRFGRSAQGHDDPLKGGRYAIESYLQHHGEKLAGRFDPNSYIVLSEAMNHHDLGRGRGGVAQALRTVRADVSIAGISSDRLYPLALQHELANHLRGSPQVAVIESAVGHDGFLLEVAQMGDIIEGVLQS
jgi:homoserine O-acetyltransferase